MSDYPLWTQPFVSCECVHYLGYRVGENGTVWSCRQPGPNRPYALFWKQLKLNSCKTNKYLYCSLRKADGSFVTVWVHRLVLEVFVGPCPENMEACHRDGDRRNNFVGNLRWDFRKNNKADSMQHGTAAIGSKVGTAKLREKEIPLIRAAYERGGVTQAELGRQFGVHQTIISDVVRREYWAHVK